jgi:outer membrane protein TolC
VYTGEELFFNYLQLKDSLVTLDMALALAQDQVRIEELKLRIGLSTATEVQKKRLAADDLADKKQALANGIDMTGRSLMRQIGVDEGTAFRLDPAYSIEGLSTKYDPDKLADLAVKNNLMLGVLDRSIDKLGDLIVDGMAPSARGQVGAQRDSLILTRDNTIQAMKLLARATATGLDTAVTELDLLEKKLLDKQAAFELMTLQVSLGLAPRIGLAASEMDLLSAQNDLTKAKQNYYLSLRKASLLVQGVAITSGSGSR